MDGYADPQEDRSVRCGVYPHRCRMREDGRGICGAQERRGERIDRFQDLRVAAVA